MMSAVRLGVITDDRIFCEGLLRIVRTDPSIVVVGLVESCPIDLAFRASHPRVLVVDSRMEGAFSMCASVARDNWAMVLFVAAPEDDEWSMRALDMGARGILFKSAHTEHLVKAIHAVAQGEVWARRRVMAAWVERANVASRGVSAADTHLEGQLSPREIEVFRQAATGAGNKELADRLAISEATVKVHLTKIFQKLGLRGRAELAAAYHGTLPSSTDRQHPRPGSLRRPA
jgi:DNA-binding NarL/FixJ family response regulator